MSDALACAVAATELRFKRRKTALLAAEMARDDARSRLCAFQESRDVARMARVATLCKRVGGHSLGVLSKCAHFADCDTQRIVDLCVMLKLLGTHKIQLREACERAERAVHDIKN
jgi:hypothetical protein